VTDTERYLTRTGHLLVEVAGDAHVGTRYRANFDVLAIDPGRPAVAVADGMGDGEGATVAGQTAVATFMARVGATAGPVTPGLLRAAVAEAQQRVRAAGARLPGLLTGCTLTALVADGAEAWLVQLGDSRAYRLRDGLLELLTVDHTEAWLGAIYGWYPPDSPPARTARYRLYRYVGHPADPEPDVLNVTLRPGDVLCLCTDGLAEQVPYHRLAQVLASDVPPAAMVATLLADALAAGGHDNATVAVLRVSPATGG